MLSKDNLVSLTEKAKSIFPFSLNQSVQPLEDVDIDCDEEVRYDHKQLLHARAEDGESCDNQTFMPNDDDTERTLEGKWPAPFDDQSAINRNLLPSLPSNFDEIKNQLGLTGTIRVRFVTWNQQGQPVPPVEEMTKHLFPHSFYHIIAVGTQECDNSISKSILNPSKENWERICGEAVGNDYELVAGHVLGGTHLALYINKAIVHLIKHVDSHAIPTGVCDKLGNKGGIAVAITIAKSTFCFLTAHLAAHQHQIDRRIYEFAKISKEIALVLGSKEGDNKNQNYQRVSASSNSQDEDYDGIEYGPSDSPEYTENNKRCISCCCHSNRLERNTLQDSFDFVFCGGDLNFRINGTRNIVDSLLENHHHNILLNNDQLRILINFDKRFAGLSEGPLTFRPTYKFDRGIDVYDTSNKMRIPAWTDRILFKTSSSSDLLSYSSVMDIRSSDHRPVYATFQCCLDIDQNDLRELDSTVGISEWACESKSEVCIIS